jgi:hypothetical protein
VAVAELAVVSAVPVAAIVVVVAVVVSGKQLG